MIFNCFKAFFADYMLDLAGIGRCNIGINTKLIEMGLDVKTIPYVMKLADTSAVVVEGKVDADKLKEAVNKVLEDVPALKQGKTEEQSKGFVQVGAGQAGVQTNTTGQQSNTPVTPSKRWNRFNN